MQHRHTEKNQSVPHPDLLPEGEGTAGGQFLDKPIALRCRFRLPLYEKSVCGELVCRWTIFDKPIALGCRFRLLSFEKSVSESHDSRTTKNRRALLPLPRGEGWGEGQTGTFCHSGADGELDRPFRAEINGAVSSEGVALG